MSLIYNFDILAKGDQCLLFKSPLHIILKSLFFNAIHIHEKFIEVNPLINSKSNSDSTLKTWNGSDIMPFQEVGL